MLQKSLLRLSLESCHICRVGFFLDFFGDSAYIVSTRGLIFTAAEIYKSQPNLVLGSLGDPVAEDPSTLRIHGGQQQQHRSLLLDTASGQRPLVALVMEPASAVGLLTDKYGVGGGNPNSNYGNPRYSH